MAIPRDRVARAVFLQEDVKNLMFQGLVHHYMILVIRGSRHDNSLSVPWREWQSKTERGKGSCANAYVS